MNISNFANIQDYIPIVSGAIITDMIVIFLFNMGLLKTITLQDWYLKYGLGAVLADVLIIVIGIIIARFLYYHLFTKYSLLYFIGLAVAIQFAHDILFYFFFSSFPTGSSRIMDTFKYYAKENGLFVLIADALMIISTVLFATLFSNLDVNTNIIILIVSLYMVPYFLYSVKDTIRIK